jgi:hypothetical protein
VAKACHLHDLATGRGLTANNLLCVMKTRITMSNRNQKLKVIARIFFAFASQCMIPLWQRPRASPDANASGLALCSRAVGKKEFFVGSRATKKSVQPNVGDPGRETLFTVTGK